MSTCAAALQRRPPGLPTPLSWRRSAGRRRSPAQRRQSADQSRTPSPRKINHSETTAAWRAPTRGVHSGSSLESFHQFGRGTSVTLQSDLLTASLCPALDQSVPMATTRRRPMPRSRIGRRGPYPSRPSSQDRGGGDDPRSKIIVPSYVLKEFHECLDRHQGGAHARGGLGRVRPSRKGDG